MQPCPVSAHDRDEGRRRGPSRRVLGRRDPLDPRSSPSGRRARPALHPTCSEPEDGDDAYNPSSGRIAEWRILYGIQDRVFALNRRALYDRSLRRCGPPCRRSRSAGLGAGNRSRLAQSGGAPGRRALTRDGVRPGSPQGTFKTRCARPRDERDTDNGGVGGAARNGPKIRETLE
jgi:hypothetical protein